ncbi:MAG TPA: hydrogenase formation protein HypD [Hadesarchaea archaeon]|nr:hydrogenase formation protein HypD [Hadesarchaea archaeon]
MDVFLIGQHHIPVEQVFRNNLSLALKLKETIQKYATTIKEREKCDTIKIMNFCGTHEWTTTHYGLRNLIPPFLDMVPGPGCPVCVVPSYYVDAVVKLAREGVRIYTYGDSFRLRSAKSKSPASLQEVKANGDDVKLVYSFLDAVKNSQSHGKESVFFGIGFETTVPSYALALKGGMVPENLKFLNVARLTPPAMKYTIKLHQERGLLPIKGIIAPGHVSTITGAVEWEFLPRAHGLPTVVAGFEPIDVLMAVAQILLMIKENKPDVKIEYKRLVKWTGNEYAKKLIGEVFDKAYAAWRGIGFIPRSGLKLKGKFFEKHDALKHFGMPDLTPREFIYTHAHHGVPWQHDLPPRCRCGEVVTGIAKPTDCPLFMKGCSPMNPWGPCMVSTEGACSIWARYGGKNSVGLEGG